LSFLLRPLRPLRTDVRLFRPLEKSAPAANSVSRGCGLRTAIKLFFFESQTKGEL
jgi:hypothetical protein